uniref:HTH_Tnp_Tc3_1 domain-containing protein n=1 Tax=Panagrellus redivivus TaxID=6233 RepID=A0A7E4UXF2_PANRE
MKGGLRRYSQQKSLSRTMRIQEALRKTTPRAASRRTRASDRRAQWIQGYTEDVHVLVANGAVTRRFSAMYSRDGWEGRQGERRMKRFQARRDSMPITRNGRDGTSRMMAKQIMCAGGRVGMDFGVCFGFSAEQVRQSRRNGQPVVDRRQVMEAGHDAAISAFIRSGNTTEKTGKRAEAATEAEREEAVRTRLDHPFAGVLHKKRVECRRQCCGVSSPTAAWVVRCVLDPAEFRR